MTTTLSFANTGKVVKPVRLTPLKAVASCTVGGFTCTGYAYEDLCKCATGKYCKAHNCGSTPPPAN